MCRSTADLLIVVSDRITRAFNGSGATCSSTWYIQGFCLTALDMLVFFTKLKCYGVSGQIFGLILCFLSDRGLPRVLDGKSPQEYPVDAGAPQGSIIEEAQRSIPLHFSYYTLMTFLITISAYNIAIYILIILLSTLSLIRRLVCDNNYRIGFSIWIWSAICYGLGQGVTCWFYCWKNWTVGLV